MATRAFTVPSTALSRLTRRARWVVGGVETDVTVKSIGNYWQLHLSGAAGLRVFNNRPQRPDRFYLPSDAWKRLITIAPTPVMPWRIASGPTLEPINAEPERVTVSGTRGSQVFSDTPLSPKKYFAPTTAPLKIFQRYAVYDPSVPVARRTGVQFMGTGMFGFPKYTAWLHVSVAGKRSIFAAGEGINGPQKRFWIPHDPRPVQRVRDAVAAAARMSDKIMLELGPVKRLVGRGNPILVGIDHLIIDRPSPAERT